MTKLIKCINLALASVLMFNISATGFAQAANLKDIRDKHSALLQQKLVTQVAVQDNTRMTALENTIRATQHRLEVDKQFLVANPDIARARAIVQLITAPNSDTFLQEQFGTKSDTTNHKIYTQDEFYTLYKKELNTEKQRATQSLKEFKDKQIAQINQQAQESQLAGDAALNATALVDWKANALADLDIWFTAAQTEVNGSIQKEASSIPSKFKKYQADITQAQDDYHQQVLKELKGYAQELMALYTKRTQYIDASILQVAPILLTFSYNNQSLFSDAQKDKILAIAKQYLATDDKCFKEGDCDFQINALAVIGMIGTETDTAIVFDFIKKYLETPMQVRILLTGVAALLAAKNYSLINSLIITAEQKEYDFSDMDILSLATMVEAASTINGQYLGKISKHGQYVNEKGAVTNAWIDIATMLAQEGSAPALDILNDFSINKCIVIYEMQLNFERTPKAFCGGIKPFTVGALISKKYNFEGKVIKAGQHNISLGAYNPVRILSGSVMTQRGTHIYTPQETLNSQQKNQNALDALTDYSKQLGLSKGAVFAMTLANNGMGDIDAKAEKGLDIELLTAFPEINKYLGEYAVVDKNRIATKTARQDRKQIFATVATVADIAIIAWCIWDIGRLAYKGIRGVSRLGNQIYHSVNIGRIGSVAARNSYMAKNLKVFQQMDARKIAFNKFITKVKNAAEPVVIGQRALYTSAPLPASYIVNRPTTVAHTLANASFDVGAGVLKVNTALAYNASTGIPNRVLDIQNTKKLLTASSWQATKEFGSVKGILNGAKDSKYAIFKNASVRESGLIYKYKNYAPYLGKNISKAASSSNAFTDVQKSELLTYAYNMKSVKNLKPGVEALAVSRQKELGIKLVSTEYMPKPENGLKTMELFVDADNGTAIGMPVQITLNGKIPGVKTDELSSVLFTKKDGKDWLKFVSNENNFIDPDFFKMGISQESMPGLIRAARANPASLDLKFMSDLKGRANYWTNTKDIFKGKKALFSGTGNVFVREGNNLRRSSIKLNTTYHNNGIRVILEPNNTLTVLNAAKKPFTAPFDFYLPKHQIGNFNQIAAAHGNFANPIGLTLSGSRNKMNPLFFITALSLSAASSGLIGPIEKNYGELSFTEKFAITVALPYAGSILSPVIAPFVKRYGAVNVLKASIGISLGALTLPMAFGFHGFGDIHGKGNNPSIAPLLVSAGMIGISSALTRSSFNPLMQSIGGSANLLKSMAFKNVSSFAMVAPPLIWLGVDAIRTTPRVDKNGQIKHDSDGDIITKKVDFAITYPFMTAVVGTSLLALQRARISSAIGRVDTYSLKASGLREAWDATKLVVKKDTWPIMLGATAVLGAEASLFNSYSMKEANRYIGPKNGVEISEFRSKLVPVGAVATTAILPFVVRYKSKAILNALGGKDNPATYNRLLALSLGTAAAGGLVLTQQDSWPEFLLGMGLVGVGFANTTNAFLKIGTFNLKAGETARAMKVLKDGGVPSAIVNEFKTLGALKAAANFKTIGATTAQVNNVLLAGKTVKSAITNFEVVYPGVHIGMALVPMLFSGVAGRREESLGESKTESLQNSLYVPMIVLGGAAAAGMYGMNKTGNLFKTFNRVPVGLVGGTRFLFGKPAIGNYMQNKIHPFTPSVKPEFFNNFQNPIAIPAAKNIEATPLPVVTTPLEDAPSATPSHSHLQAEEIPATVQ